MAQALRRSPGGGRGEPLLLCVGGTPAMQRTLLFRSLRPGAVNRAHEVHVTASGKMVNVARMVATLGNRVLLASFLGGDSGRFISRTLGREGVEQEMVWVQNPTRTCITLIPEGGPVTELVEEAPPVSATDAAALEAASVRHLGSARALCLAGSLPPGVPEDFYARLVKAAGKAGVPVLVDVQRAPLRAALEEHPFLVKPNLEEARATLNLPERSDARTAVRALTEAGAEWALVSEGERGSLLGNGSGNLWRIEPPGVEAVNPIGSGDALAAGILRSLMDGSNVPEAVVYGTACAAANVLTPTSGVIRTEDVSGLLPRVRFSELA